MHRRPTPLPATTSRRDVLLAAGTALALKPAAVRAAARRSYLATLLRRRAELERLLAALATETEQLRRYPCTPAVRKRWTASRRAEARASEALERLEWVIADTPAETLEDIALKLRFCAELQGYGGEPARSGWRAPLTVEEHLLRTILADLKRLKKNTLG